jgi:cobalt-zinc-cadmium efflux system outer membrane protein
MRTFLTGGMIAMLTCSAYAGQSSFTLRQLQESAVQNSPGLKSLEQKLNAAYAVARQQGRWVNPEFETTIDGSEQDFSLRQPVDLWGKRSLARQVGNADAAVSSARLESARQDLRFQVAQQFWALASATEAQSLLDKELDAWDRLLAVRQGELKAGEISASDLLTEQALWSQRRQARWKLAAQGTSARNTLNSLLGRPPGTPLALASPNELKLNLPDAQSVVTLAIQLNPALRGARRQLQAAGIRVTQEHRRWAPDLSIGPSLRRTKEGAFPGIFVLFSVPIWDRNRDGIQAAEFNRSGVQDDLESAERQIAQKAFTAYQLWVQANDAFEQQRSIIEKMVQPQESLAEQTYHAGGMSERDLLLVQIDALQRQAELATLRGDLGLARARLDLMISGGR